MTAPWITYRPELKVLDCTDPRRRADQRPPLRRRLRQGRLPGLRRGGDRLHGGRLQGLQEDLRPRQVRRLEVLRRGRHAPGRGRQPHAAEALGHGRRRQVGLANRHPAQEAERAGHDPRGLLRPPGAGGGRHDPGRRRQGLRGLRQPDGRFPRHGARDRAGPGAAGPDAGRARSSSSTVSARSTPSRSSSW